MASLKTLNDALDAARDDGYSAFLSVYEGLPNAPAITRLRKALADANQWCDEIEASNDSSTIGQK